MINEPDAIEPEPRTVFLVTRGEYSDYSIVAAFSTRARAEEFVAWRKQYPRYPWGEDDPWGEDVEIEEMIMDRPIEQRGMWNVIIDSRGAVVSSEFNPDEICFTMPHAVARSASEPAYARYSGYGRTQEHARRSAEELRRQTIALGTPGT